MESSVKTSRNGGLFEGGLPEENKGNDIAGLLELEDAVEKLKSEFMIHMENGLGSMIDNVIDSLQRSKQSNKSEIIDPNTMKDKRKASIVGRLPEKEFRLRPSPLTELLEVSHFKTIHNIFISTLVLIMLHTILLDLLEKNTLDFGVERLIWAFQEPQLMIGLMLFLNLFSLAIIYPSFYLWANYRTHSYEYRRLIDLFALLISFIYFILLICLPAYFLQNNPQRGLASSCAVCMEQCRVLMKNYAFIRTNAGRVLNEGRNKKPEKHAALSTDGKATLNEESTLRLRNTSKSTLRKTESGNDSESSSASKGKPKSKKTYMDERMPCPTYSKYLYFFFAPTLIYKNEYPRTSKVRWDYVCWNFAQVIGCIIYGNFLIGRYCFVFFGNFGHPDHPTTPIHLLNAIFSLMLPGIVGLVLGFFLFLHAWQNAFAEMLCFGDRLFYKDWWNCTSFSAYYKTWNLLVHDWLYTYVFKDAAELGLGKKLSFIPTTLVFVLSALFHEYILTFSFNFFFPVLLTLFGGFGFALVFIKGPSKAGGNVFIWCSLIAGTGIMVAAYSMEYYARQNCPPIKETVWSAVTPRFWTCNAIKWTL